MHSIILSSRVFMIMSMLSFLIACGAKPIKIGGQVISDTGVPIAKAEVNTIPPTDITTTDDAGYFVIHRALTSTGEPENIKPGLYKIVIKKTEYEDFAFEVNAEKGEIWTDKHMMKKQQIQFEDVAPEKSEEQQITNGNTAVPNQGI